MFLTIKNQAIVILAWLRITVSESITLYELLSLVISFFGFAAVAISLIFLIRQTKLLVQSVKCDTYASITGNLTVTKQIFIENPELRPYFYSDIDISEDDSDNYRKALSVAEHLLDFFDGVLLQDSPLWPEDLWTQYIKDSFKRSPILRTYLLQNSGWYTDRLLTLMSEALKEQQAATAG